MKHSYFFLTFILLLFIGTGLTIFTKNTMAADGSWHTQGNQIVDSQNRPVKMAGINWFGFETGSFAPHGLWSRGYKEMLEQIKSLGYNTVRLPYSNQALDSGTRPSGIDYSKNSDLQGKTSLEVMDAIINYAGQIGLKVLLDRHRPDSKGQSSLWYTDAYPESRWISDWVMLANRYRGNSTVVGADLHNEPHDNACWGCGDPRLDWQMAATKAGNAIMAANSDWLIIVEGVQQHSNSWYWWGGNLMGVKDKPVVLNVANRVVYSTHDYPSTVSWQPWFGEGSYPTNLPALWDKHWGYIIKQNIAPVLVGEFGTKLETESDKVWLDTLVKYLGETGASWTFWCFNPNSGDTGGILMDDWVTVHQGKQSKLTGIMGGFSAPITQPTPTPSVTPTPNPSPTVTPTPQPSVTPSPVVTTPAASGKLDIWWPVNGVTVTGTQPFKALVPGLSLADYDMFWQVDGGQLNVLGNSPQDYPHKESTIDLSGWRWRDTKLYTINFVAKSKSGQAIAERSVVIRIP